MTDYQPIPTSTARQIATNFNKQVVVVAAIDYPHDKMHITSYGFSPADKMTAAHLGDLVSKVANPAGDARKQPFEDFRSVRDVPLNEHTQKILGLSREQIRQVCRVLREAGDQIPEDVLSEQAAAIHWLLAIYGTYGADWGAQADKHLNDMATENLAAMFEHEERL